MPVNGYYGADMREDEDEFYSEDKTSNFSQTQSSRFYQDLIETHEVSTQLTQDESDDLPGSRNPNYSQVVLYN